MDNLSRNIFCDFIFDRKVPQHVPQTKSQSSQMYLYIFDYIRFIIISMHFFTLSRHHLL